MYQNKEQKVLHQFSKIKEQNTLYQNKEQNVLYQYSKIKSKILFYQNKEQNALYQNKEQLLVVQDKEQNQDKEEPFGRRLLFKWGWTVGAKFI